MIKSDSNCIVIGLLFFLFILGLGLRYHVLNAQYRQVGDQLPFTLESALQYRMTLMAMEPDGLPKIDTGVQYPEGVEMAKTYTLGAEGVYGLGAKLFFWSGPEHAMRLMSLLLFCLGIPALCVWSYGLCKDKVGAFISGLIYAVCLAAIIRSTGQELSRENLGLPLFLCSMAFFHMVQEFTARHGRWCMGLACLSLAGALAFWDLIQFILGLVLIAWATQLILCRRVEGLCLMKRCSPLVLLTMLVCAVMNPYLRSHSFYLSPVFFLAVANVFLVYLRFHRLDTRWDSVWARAGMVLLILVGGGCSNMCLGSSYGHFFELLQAKLLFGNVKPLDPSLLTFDQRIMWTPALHSATWALTEDLFPGMFYAGLVAFVILLAYGIRTSNLTCIILALSFLFLVVMYVLFVRFHVFTIIFCALMVGYAVRIVRARRGIFRWVFLIGLGVCLLCEMQNVLYKPGPRFGRPNTYYDSLKSLTDWLAKNAEQKPVLANFGVSGSIAAYGQCPIILHPKFETQAIRDRVEGYATALFKGDERAFRDWADQYGAQYYVFSMGEFYSKQIPYQLRYMVDALDEGMDTAARKFNKNNPHDLRYFRLVWNDSKYRVFDILTGDEEKTAQRYFEMAERALTNGDIKVAKKRAMSALSFDIKHEGALRVMKQSATLTALGVEYETPKKHTNEGNKEL